MTGRYRNKLQIIADVLLSVGKEGAKKTQIMYKANLSYKLLNYYLTKVLKAKLVTVSENDCFVLTAKGEEFIEKFHRYSRRCKRLQEQVENLRRERLELEEMCSFLKS